MTGDKVEVLLLEPDGEAASILESLLTSMGCEVNHCLRAHEALFAVSMDTPKLLLLSAPLATSTVAGFLGNLKSMENSENITIASLLPPGDEHEETVEELTLLGITEHLRKPVTHGEIRALLARLPSAPAPETKNLFDKLRQDVSVASFKSVLLHDLTEPEKAASSEPANTAKLLETDVPPPTEEVVAPEPQGPEEPEIDGPKMVAYLEEGKVEMTIEKAVSESLVAWVGSERLTVGSEFGTELSYKDPAPGRNRRITLYLQLRVSSCVPAGERSFRATLKVEDVKPEERWNQFLRVCAAALEPGEED